MATNSNDNIFCISYYLDVVMKHTHQTLCFGEEHGMTNSFRKLQKIQVLSKYQMFEGGTIISSAFLNEETES